MLGLISVAVLSLSSLFSPVFAQSTDASQLVGTWSSGSRKVSTGAGFANPVNFSFTYPPTTGISWSFTSDGFFEQAEYRMQANGTTPKCIVGTVLFQHGKYEALSNGSIVAEPFAVDGRLQVQDPCAAKSNVILQFNTTVLMKQWAIFTDPQLGPKLQLYRYDGAPLAPMYQIANPPNMLPTTTLTQNATIGGDGSLILNAAYGQMRQAGFLVLGTIAGVAIGVLTLAL